MLLLGGLVTKAVTGTLLSSGFGLQDSRHELSSLVFLWCFFLLLLKLTLISSTHLKEQ